MAERCLERVRSEVWLSFFLVAIAGFLGSGFLLGIAPAIILDSVGCGSLLGAGVSLAFRVTRFVPVKA